MVVFTDKSTVKMGGRDLHVRTFQSNKPSELAAFAAKAYSRDGITASTVLYEAMLAALELTREMPATEPQFIVVFSDGEDLNSAFKRDDVVRAAQGPGGYRAYAIDYMPVPVIDEFLSRFASQNRGQAWKATSQTNLVPIFQEVAATMEYYYVLNYRFPPSGSMAVTPASLRIDEIVAVGVGEKDPPKASGTLKTGIDASALTLRPVVDSVHGIARWKAVLENANGAVADLGAEGAPAAELKMALPTRDLQSLAAGGDLTAKMEVQDTKGQTLRLTAPPIKVQVAQARARLAVVPDTLTIDEIWTLGTSEAVGREEAGTVKAGIDRSALLLRPALESAGWIAGWKMTVENAKGSVLARLEGEGAPATEVEVPLPTADLQALAAGGDLRAQLELRDREQQHLVVTAPPVKIDVVQTRAGLSVTPASLRIEEIKIIDSSPTLAHVYFDRGSSEIPGRYRRFSAPAETAGFDEQKFRDTLEKYYHLLNIVGKRLTGAPSARITLVGCNDASSGEKGIRGLSTRRAEAVRDYLQTVWGTSPDRMTVEARNLPVMPSTSRSEEGQAENRRVEILSSDATILAPALSTYTATRMDSGALTLRPDVVAPHGIDRWLIECSNAGGTLASLKGEGPLARETRVPLSTGDLRKLAEGGDIRVTMELHDRKGQRVELAAPPVKVHFVEISQRLAEKKDRERVQERYALILFDFDKDTVGPLNQGIVDSIAARIRALPEAAVEIVGHTDNTGREDYNLKLSERRASEVYKRITAALGGAAGDRIRYSGVGPNSPLYDNLSPEARGFNRTVTVTIEYLSAE
jgi:outer membrane protein OmpA-like peptidoglycan-associated protein